MSFHEKSAWACIAALLIVFVPYFFYVFQYPMAYVGLFVVAVVVLSVLLIGFHGFNALFSPSLRKSGSPPDLDERDKSIEIKAAKVSGILLGILVMCWCLNAMCGIPIAATINFQNGYSEGSAASLNHFSIPAFKALLWVHALFAAFVFANLSYYAMIVYAYRRST